MKATTKEMERHGTHARQSAARRRDRAPHGRSSRGRRRPSGGRDAWRSRRDDRRARRHPPLGKDQRALAQGGREGHHGRQAVELKLNLSGGCSRAEPSNMTSRIGGVVSGKYRLDEELGRGGMGAVYRAFHLRVHKEFALKMLLGRRDARHRSIASRFQLEAQAAGRIGHPGILDVYDVGEDADGTPFIVMELLRGEPLSALVRTWNASRSMPRSGLRWRCSTSSRRRTSRASFIEISSRRTSFVTETAAGRARREAARFRHRQVRGGRGRQRAHAERRDHRLSALHGARASEGRA